MNTTETDAQLVASHLAGDPSALAGIYDRYADSLHDTAAAMLNDRHESADVLHDVILIAAERLGQLRDPERLKPWLFAILRNEVFRRTKKRRRTVATDYSGAAEGTDMADDRQLDVDHEVTEESAGEDLAKLVRDASRGLDDRDQLVLELSVRQGLEGQALADALGVSANQSYTLVHRMRERVERSLGAFVVAKAGRKDCETLDKLLGAWDGEFNVLIRKRVARHIDSCEVCDSSRGRFAPMALFAGAPVLAAPPFLRDQILTAAAAQTVATPYGFTAVGGFPKAVRGARHVAAWIAPTAAASLILVASTLAFIWLDRGDDSDTIRAALTEESTTTTIGGDALRPVRDGPAVPDSTTTAVDDNADNSTTTAPTTTATTTATTSSPTTASSTIPATTEAPVVSVTPNSVPPPATAPPPTTTATTTATTTSTSSTTTTVPTPGEISLSGDLIDLGASATSGVVTVTNTGGQPLEFTVTAATGSTAPFTVSPTGGTLEPGQSQQIEASIDRVAVPEGAASVDLQVAAAGVSRPLGLRAKVERPPLIDTTAPSVATGGPFGAGCSLVFTALATITDESPPVTASLHLSGGPLGQSETVTMTSAAASDIWSGTVQFLFQSSSEVNGTWNWAVEAIDDWKNVATRSGTVAVSTSC